MNIFNKLGKSYILKEDFTHDCLPFHKSDKCKYFVITKNIKNKNILIFWKNKNCVPRGHTDWMSDCYESQSYKGCYIYDKDKLPSFIREAIDKNNEIGTSWWIHEEKFNKYFKSDLLTNIYW